MTKDERRRGRAPMTALALACAALWARPAAAQDPPPPLVPAEPQVPDAPPASPPPDAPPPAPTPLPPSATPLPPGATPLPPAATPLPPEATPAPPEATPGAPSEPRRAGARVLKGHAFTTPFLIDSAISQTSLGLGLEIGRQWEYGVIRAGRSPMGTDYQYQYDRALGAATQYLSFGVQVSERVEIGLSASYTSLLPGDVNAAVLFGGRNAWTLRPGIRARLIRSPSTGTQLGLHVYGDFGAGSWQNPAGVLAEIVNEAGQISNDPARGSCLAAGDLACALKGQGFDAQTTALTSRSQYGGGATVGLAQLVGGGFALQAALGLDVGYASTSTAGSSLASVPVAFHVGVAPSLSFGPSVPIELMAEYLLTVVDESTVGTPTGPSGMVPDAGTLLTIQNGAAFGVYYTGRHDLSVGAIFSATFAKATISYSGDSSADGSSSATQPPLTRLAGQVTARYYF